MSKGDMTPVKFAALVFFEEFNGASRGQRTDDRGQKSEVRGQRAEAGRRTKNEGLGGFYR